jgi:Tesmin/TSO1-like CXC domain, cysteine-rich domain
MNSDELPGSSDSARGGHEYDEESFWDGQTMDLLASAGRGTDPFPLGASRTGSPRTPGSLLPFWASPSYLSNTKILPSSRKKARLPDSVSSPTHAVDIAVDGSGKSTEKLLEPIWIAEALLELDSTVRDGTNTPLKRREASCRCTKSKCLKLYCSCYSAGMACTPFCSCVGCENTKASGIANHPPTCNCVGCRSVKMETSLKVVQGNSSQSQACSCKASRCLKLYCACFQSGSFCNPSCHCKDCSNTLAENAENGAREAAIMDCLRRRSDAFDVRPKGTGDVCYCKTNR